MEQKKYKIYKNMYQREHFFRLVKNGLEVVFSLISENQNAETLQFDLSKCERIKIEYTSPSFVGVKTLTTQKYGGNYYEIVGENKIKIVLSNLHNAPYLLNGVAFYGSYTLSICSLQIDVPSNVSKGIQDLGTITQVVVKSFEIGGGGGGGGFTPTETQLQAINSGATAEKITQISENQTDIEYLGQNKQNKITDVVQSNPPMIMDTISGLTGTTNKIWTFNQLWEFIKLHVGVLLTLKQDKITDSTQSSDPTDSDYVSDLNGTTNKRWTFLSIWNYIKGKFTYDTNYTDAPEDTDTLANLDKDTAKIKRITFANLWTWIWNKVKATFQTRLNGDYYYAFVKDNTTYYTKDIADGEVDVYAITKTEGYVSEITKQSAKGTLANGVLTFSEVEYTHNILADGFFVVKENEKAVAVSAVQDVMEKAGKVNDIKVANVSQVKDKVASIKTIDNLEDNWYYAFKNGSTYRYTKSKAVGQTACYEFTYTENVLTKIENIGNITVYLNEDTIPELSIGTTKYTLDETKNDYYIIDSEQVLPSAKCATQDLTDNDIKRIFEGFYLTPPTATWRYVGILGASANSTLTVEDDWTELLIVTRVAEGSYYYNITDIIPKYAFTQGSPTNGEVMTGFYWNGSFYAKSRIGLQGTGTNRYVKKGHTDQMGWAVAGFYIYKR